ncbi:malto-oligosyltrehalose synthase [Tunturibacter empetritectus]|uniref:(1->4)-alpha-D-glucan 1-alpha-D-glucosylmutase n=1 Tax=Tunturiibacter lichenicola TaxID=2051959 RepID=A0A852VBX3_9BACT|nr:malto-oligosyltrehalose synthase [Edaphobacter lichenicola]NYF88781.1 (1->4)-alpha-D-glucan 1-alpha-D-glucosylmutase [Edaphobacter lichenicola]
MMLRTPGSTYRLQLHKDFTFDDAARIADYLHELGISHVYSSPYLQAAPESMHGYDVVDHQKVNQELGGAAAHERFCKKLGEAGLGQVLDIVPNHMSLGKENRFWWDVLENGTSSRYASFFDIDWQPQEERLRDKVLVPILGDQYGRVLQTGGIKVVRRAVKFQVECSGQSLPVSPQSLPVILTRAAEYAKSDTLSFLAASFGRLPAPEYVDRRTILARHRDKVVLFTLLDRLCAEEPAILEGMDRSAAELNENLDALDDFLNQQNYRLAYWKTADQQLSYRRFFDVNTLIGLRVEREYVFEETHALVLDWLRRGVLDGVRVDHPDGLRDPKEYFKRLRERAPDAWVIGEKILEPGEFLREDWPVEGTSGYDFLNVAGAVLVAPEGLMELSTLYADFTGQPTDFHAIAHEKKINVSQEALGSDVNRLTSIFVEICEANRDERDYTRAEVRRAIREVAACFSIYRTYVVPEREEITEEDREYITQAAECAKETRQDIDGGLFDFLRDVLTMQVKGRLESEFLLRFQQFTGPVMAKGVEDTAFYCYNRLTGMNEVGSDPGRNGLSVEEFHSYCRKMQETHPCTMTTLSTHDTKRSDDVRARMAVLSEIPEKFGAAIQRWSRMNNAFRARKPGVDPLPDRNTEYFYYQTLIGAWPLPMDRAQAYMLKAMREAKQQTTWVANNKEFEEALKLFIEFTYSYAPFQRELQQFVERILEAGRVNSLAQTLLKYTAPGVPDLYQGTELWDLSLVDPDNRRPVDYALRQRLLQELKQMNGGDAAAQVMARADDGLPKMWTIHKALHLRRERPASFGTEADYVPLMVDGAKHDHVIAYLRGEDVVTVVPRLMMKLGGAWRDTVVTLPEGRWRNRLTGVVVEGGEVEVRELLKDFPVALLAREEVGGDR